MKSNLHKLIGAFLAVCLVVAVMTMGAFASASENVGTPPTLVEPNPSGSDGDEYSPVTVSFAIMGTYSQFVRSISVTVNGQTTTYSASETSFRATLGSSVSITVNAYDGYAVTANVTSGTCWSTSGGNSVSTSSLTENNGGVIFNIEAKERHNITSTVSYVEGITQSGAYITSASQAYAGETVTVTVSMCGGQKVRGICVGGSGG